MPKDNFYTILVVDDATSQLKMACSIVIESILGPKLDHIGELSENVFSQDARTIRNELFSNGTGEFGFKLYSAQGDKDITIITASNGLDAFDKFLTCQKQGGFIHAIITDHDMKGSTSDPERDGSAFLNKVREYARENGKSPEDIMMISTKKRDDITTENGFEFKPPNDIEVQYHDKECDIRLAISSFVKNSFQKWLNISKQDYEQDLKEDFEALACFDEKTKDDFKPYPSDRNSESRDEDSRPSSSAKAFFLQSQRPRSSSKGSIIDL